MTHPLEQRWAITRQRLEACCRHLRSLRSDLEAERSFAAYREMLEHNELQLALDALEHLGESSALPAAAWEELAAAAESMGLTARAASCRRKSSEAPS